MFPRLITLLLLFTWLLPSGLDAAIFKHRRKTKDAWKGYKHKAKRSRQKHRKYAAEPNPITGINSLG